MSESTSEDDHKIMRLKKPFNSSSSFCYKIKVVSNKGNQIIMEWEQQSQHNLSLISQDQMIKKWRSAVHALRAVRRLTYFTQQRTLETTSSLSTRQNIINYQKSVGERIEKWTKGVYTKALTYTRTIYDFFENGDPKKVDNARLQAANACIFLFQSLALFTQKEYFPECLRNLIQMQSQQSTRSMNNYFTNLRINLHSEQLIAAETILMDILVTHLIKSDIADRFIKRVLISILQIMYLKEFQQMPHINKPKGVQISLTPKLAIEEKKERNPADVQLEGVYSIKALELMMHSTCNFELKLSNFFSQILENLI